MIFFKILTVRIASWRKYCGLLSRRYINCNEGLVFPCISGCCFVFESFSSETIDAHLATCKVK